MTTTTTPDTLPRPLMGAYVALVLDALEQYTGPLPFSLPRQLYSGVMLLAWSGPGLPPPSHCKPDGIVDTWATTSGQWTGYLINAISDQAHRYGAQGLDISARDCFWLIAQLKAGALQLVTRDVLQAIGGRVPTLWTEA